MLRQGGHRVGHARVHLDQLVDADEVQHAQHRRGRDGQPQVASLAAARREARTRAVTPAESRNVAAVRSTTRPSAPR